MVKSVFTKNNFKIFFICLLAVVIISVGTAIGLFFYFGHSVQGKDLTEGLGDKLSYGSSFSVSDITKEENYNYSWLNSDEIDVEVYALNNDGESVATKEILSYSEDTRTFEVIGVASGTIKFTSSFDDTITYSVPFSTNFKSNDTEAILNENYPQIFSDNIISSSELLNLTVLTIQGKETVDLADFSNFYNLKKLEIKNNPDAELVSFKNFNLPTATNIYVSTNQYLDYVNRADGEWQSYWDRIYPSSSSFDKHSIVFYKNDGVLADDNGLEFKSVEVEDNDTLNLSTDFTISRTGYQFKGWFITDDGITTQGEAISDNYQFNADTKLLAKWQANTYTIRLFNNDGTEDYTEKTFVYDNEDDIADELPQYDSFIQLGWGYDKDDHEESFSNHQTILNITSDNNAVIDLYAIWAYKNFQIQYYSWDNNKEYKTYGSVINVVYGNDIQLSSFSGQPSSYYGSFDGWSLKEDSAQASFGYGDVVDSVSGKLYMTSRTDGILKIYAIFKLEQYDIIYKANGGNTEPARVNGISRGVSVNLSAPIEREGYKFMGWQDDVGDIWLSEELYNADTNFYDSNYKNKLQEVPFTTDGFNASNGIVKVTKAEVTLTAVWRANSFKVKFNSNGADSIFSNENKVYYGQSYSFKGEATKTGHTYNGVSSNIGGISTNNSLTSAQVRTLYLALLGNKNNNNFNQNDAITFTPSFNVNDYTLTISTGTGSTLSVTVNGVAKYDGTHLVAYGSTIVASCWANSGYHGANMNGGGTYTMPAYNITINSWATKDECLASGTLITMADNTMKSIENVMVGDSVLVWDFIQGKYSTSVVAYIEHDTEMKCMCVDLLFADNTTVTLITEHGFFDFETNKYVYITPVNAQSFVGHKFFKMVEENGVLSYSEVELVDVVIEERIVGTHSMVTADQLSHFANGYLSIAAGIDGLFNIFDVNNDMKYDEESVIKDIETYGLYTYEDFAEYVSYEEFLAFNGAYLKISVGKGLTTFEKIIEMINLYLK